MSNSININRVPPFSWNSRGLEILYFKKMENMAKVSAYNRGLFVESILKAARVLKEYI